MERRGARASVLHAGRRAGAAGTRPIASAVVVAMSSLVGSLCARPTAARLRSRLRRGDDAPRRAGPPRAGLAEREPDEGGVAATEVDLRVHRRALGLAVSLGAACQAVDALVLADRAGRGRHALAL
eukprot:scaffold1676_cov373-Prasinococcus_capsulatus_cf.AAC.2